MLALIIIIFGILSRIVLHTPNFTPILSLALFGGMYLKGRQGIWVPLLLMVLSDAIVGFHDTMAFTWGSIFLISLMGVWSKNHKSLTNVIGTSIGASCMFFLITNFGAFLSFYPHTSLGLQKCYVLAIPFFRSTLASTVVYSVVLYVGYEWLLKQAKQPALARLL